MLLHIAKFVICGMHWVMESNTTSILFWCLRCFVGLLAFFCKGQKLMAIVYLFAKYNGCFTSQTPWFPFCWHVLPILHMLIIMVYNSLQHIVSISIGPPNDYFFSITYISTQSHKSLSSGKGHHDTMWHHGFATIVNMTICWFFW
jgi:hypothetical protein